MFRYIVTSATHIGTEIIFNAISNNQQLAKELRKPIIKTSKKRKIYSSFKDNICEHLLIWQVC